MILLKNELVKCNCICALSALSFLHGEIIICNFFRILGENSLRIYMYADIFGCIPIAEALLAKGARLGVVLSFMMGVTTLSLPSIIMLKKAVKSKLLGIFVAICTLGIIIVGYFFNAFQYLLV